VGAGGSGWFALADQDGGARPIGVAVRPRHFVEDGLLAAAEGDDALPADGVICGVGRVDGRKVAVIAHDFTVKAGSWGARTCEKQIRLLERPTATCSRWCTWWTAPAAADRPDGFLPRPSRCLGDLPSTGATVRPGAAVVLPARAVRGRRRLRARVLRLGRHGRGHRSMYLPAPRVAERSPVKSPRWRRCAARSCTRAFPAAGTRCSARTPRPSRPPGCCCPTCPTTSALPADRAGAAPEYRLADGMVPADPNTAYDVRDVIEGVVDAGSFFEIKARWAEEMVVGLARLDGRVIGLIANQPKGCAVAPSSSTPRTKRRGSSPCAMPTTSRCCSCTTLPGFMVGVAVERAGIIRHGAKMIVAMSSAEVPRISVVLRKAYAAGYTRWVRPDSPPVPRSRCRPR